MLAKVKSAAVVGLEGAIVEVEVDLSPGLPSFTQVATQYQLWGPALDLRL
jgi:hypothetical protein